MTDLPKHDRPRWRYLAVGVETWPDATLDRRALQGAVWEAVRDLYGDAGSAAIDGTVLRCDCADGGGFAVVRVRRGEEARGRAAVASLRAVDGHPVGCRVRGVSGTVRACEEKYMDPGREGPEQSDVVFENATRDAVVRGERVDVRTDDGFSGATGLDIQ